MGQIKNKLFYIYGKALFHIILNIFISFICIIRYENHGYNIIYQEYN